MKKMTKIATVLLMSVMAFSMLSCNHGNGNKGSKPVPDPTKPTPTPTVDPTPVDAPADSIRKWAVGSATTEWGVYTVEDLEKLSEIVNNGITDFAGNTIYLMNDIVINENVLSADFEEPAEGEEEGTANPNLKNLDSIGSGEDPDKTREKSSFCGTFDGQGKIISGLYMYQGHQGLGFFGYVDGATIKNVIIIDACVINRNLIPNPDPASNYPHDNKDDDRFGGLIGWVDGEGAEVSNCLFAGVVGSQAAKERGDPYEYIGGLIGRCDGDVDAENCTVFATIWGSGDIICKKGVEKITAENVEGYAFSDYTQETYKAALEEAIAAVQSRVLYLE